MSSHTREGHAAEGDDRASRQLKSRSRSAASLQRDQRGARGREHRQSGDRGKRGGLRERAVERHGQRDDGVGDDRDVRRAKSRMHAAQH